MKIGFIGCGNMGSAIARATAQCGAELCLYDKRAEAASRLALLYDGMTVKDEDEACRISDVVFLAVKPNVLPDVLSNLSKTGAADGKLVVSMAAGVTIEKIESYLPTSQVIRIMPNTPVAVGSGMILWCKGSRVSSEACEIFTKILATAGELMEIDEALIDAATAVSGCGPAFAYAFIDAMAEGGVRAGLDTVTARRLAASTVIGAARMICETKEEPSALIDAVCSPGGSTIEGVKVLREGGLSELVADAVSASYRRTTELGK